MFSQTLVACEIGIFHVENRRKQDCLQQGMKCETCPQSPQSSDIWLQYLGQGWKHQHCCPVLWSHSVIFGLKAEAEAWAMVFFLDSGISPFLLPMAHMYKAIPMVLPVSKYLQRASRLL